MELWIRTHDKECLTKVDHLHISNDCVIKQQDDIVLAVYKTKERALEVLDEIQNILIDYKEMSRVVYQMPQE